MDERWRRSSCLNWGERQCVMKTIAMISCCVMSLRSHSSAMSRILFEYATIPSLCSCGSLNSSILLASRGCLSAIQSAMMSMHDFTSSSLGFSVKTGVFSLIRLYRCCSSSRSTQPEMVACLPGMLVTPQVVLLILSSPTAEFGRRGVGRQLPWLEIMTNAHLGSARCNRSRLRRGGPDS